MDQNFAPMLHLGLEIYDLSGVFQEDMKHCEKLHVLSCVTHGKKRKGTKKPSIEVQNKLYLLQKTVHGAKIKLFDAQVLIFSLNFTDFQIASAGKTFLAEKLMNFFFRKLSPRAFLVNETLQKHEKVLVRTNLPKLKADKRSFSNFRQNITPVGNF